MSEMKMLGRRNHCDPKKKKQTKGDKKKILFYFFVQLIFVCLLALLACLLPCLWSTQVALDLLFCSKKRNYHCFRKGIARIAMIMTDD